MAHLNRVLCGEWLAVLVDRLGRILSDRDCPWCRGLVRRLVTSIGAIGMIRQMPGFRSYYLLDGGPDVLITISRFDSTDEAFASNEKAADWVRNNVLEFTKGIQKS
ncbi:MAG TPA: hypothetical protein VN798_07500 [Pseudomonas sp.]|nr:hypothetical protein [Pseudomonas sp.]